MNKENLIIEGIPVVIWGETSNNVFIAVHGNMSHKEDDVIRILAEELAEKEIQVLSFDLPEHGDRKELPERCKVQRCVKELEVILGYANNRWQKIGLFGCSIGAYFSLMAYQSAELTQCLFLSPVVDMERLIHRMMGWFAVSEVQLEREKEISTPIGQVLYWDYFCYVKENPVLKWSKPTAILYGSEDDLCQWDTISGFAQKFSCKLTVLDSGEHFFHTEEQLDFYRQWVKNNITK